MDNITFVELENIDGSTTEHAIIAYPNGSFTSMHKSTYDEMIAQQGQHLTENPTEGDE